MSFLELASTLETVVDPRRSGELARALQSLGLGQHDRLIRLDTPMPANLLVPERARVVEEINDGFDIQIDALSPLADPNLAALLGQEVTLRLLLADGRRRPWHGIVFGVARLGSDGACARHRVEMRPWTDLLKLRRDNFVYQDADVQAILSDLFRDYPQAYYRFELADTTALRPRSLCAQRDESDWAFMTRLLAEEGLSFHFKHDDDGDPGLGGSPAPRGMSRHCLVIADARARRPDLGAIRYAQARDSADAADIASVDTLVRVALRAQAGSNAVTLGSWNYKKLMSTTSQAKGSLAHGRLPELERYDGAGAYRYQDSDHADRAARIELQRIEQHHLRGQVQGTARRLLAGAEFDLVEHPALDGRYLVLRSVHEMANNLGSDASRLLAHHDLERGGYRCRGEIQPADVAVMPDRTRHPTAVGTQSALVVGHEAEAVTTERDGRVKVQRHWQRGLRPNPGGLPHDEASPDARGNAPGNVASGTWTRSLRRAAGANHGAQFTPRRGSEVLLDHMDGDEDRALIVGQLHNGRDRPPFAAGVGSDANHPGVLAGVHTPTLDGKGFNEWVIDDTMGQLRMRMMCSYTMAEVGLGHLIQHTPARGLRGAARGTGFELATRAWASLRAGGGLLVSTSARPGTGVGAGVTSTQMDCAEAVGLLEGAQNLGERLNQAVAPLQGQALGTHQAGQAAPTLIQGLDPQREGKYPGPVGGQDASRPDGTPVERPATPTIVFDSASALAAVSQGLVATMAGGSQCWVAQDDAHDAAGRTASLVAGQTASWTTIDGGMQLKAAHGPVQVQAHADALRILADTDAQFLSVGDEITITAATRIELTAAGSRICLNGADIDFITPGKFLVHSATHDWEGGASNPVSIPPLPTGKLYQERFRLKDSTTGSPKANVQYWMTVDGETFEGFTDDDGWTQIAITGAPQNIGLEVEDGGVELSA